MISDEALAFLHAAAFRMQEAIASNAGVISFAGGSPKEAKRALDRAMQEVENEQQERGQARAKADQEAAKLAEAESKKGA